MGCSAAEVLRRSAGCLSTRRLQRSESAPARLLSRQAGQIIQARPRVLPNMVLGPLIETMVIQKWTPPGTHQRHMQALRLFLCQSRWVSVAQQLHVLQGAYASSCLPCMHCVFSFGQGHLCPPGELKRRKKQKWIAQAHEVFRGARGLLWSALRRAMLKARNGAQAQNSFLLAKIGRGRAWVPHST